LSEEKKKRHEKNPKRNANALKKLTANVKLRKKNDNDNRKSKNVKTESKRRLKKYVHSMRMETLRTLLLQLFKP